MRIEGAVAVVTGGASGIGRATAIALARAGADVVVADIDGPGAEATAAEIGGLAVRADLARRDEVERVVEHAIAARGHVDLFVSNAGVGCEGDAHTFTVDQWESLLALDLMASIWAMRLLVPHMLERGSGRLAFVASGAGYESFADRAPYCVAKFGLVALAEALARQLKDSGVGVSVIVPGAVATDGWRQYVFAGTEEEPGARDAVREHVRFWPSPESMAAVIVDGLRDDRFHILQPYDAEPTWFTDIFRRRAEDPDGFVLG